MSQYEEAISQLVSTMQEKLYELQAEKNSQISKRSNLTARLTELRKSNAEMLTYRKYLQDQISLLSESSNGVEEEKEDLARKLQTLSEKNTLLDEQVKNDKNAWTKERDFIKAKLNHIENQFRVESLEEEKLLKNKASEIIRLEKELKELSDELKSNQNKVEHKRQLELSRVKHLEERSRILDSIYKNK